MSQTPQLPNSVFDDIVDNEGGDLMEATFRKHDRTSDNSAHRPGERVEGVHKMISELDRVVNSALDDVGQYDENDFSYTHHVITERVAPCASCNHNPTLISKESIHFPDAAIEYAVRCLAHSREYGTLFEAKRKSAIIAKWNQMQVRLKHLSAGHLQQTSEGQKLALGTIKKVRRIS